MDNLNRQDGMTASALKQVLDECKSAAYLMLFVTFVINIFSVAPILYVMNVFDRVLPTNSTVTLISLLTLVLGIYVFWTALEWLRTRLLIRISLRLDWDMAGEVFNACVSKSLTNKDPNVHQVMGDLLTLRQFLTGPSVLAIVEAPFALIFIAVGYLIHPYIALFILAATVITFAITLFTRKVTTPVIKAASEYNLEANRVAAASLRNVESAMVMGMLPALKSRWADRHQAYLQHHVNSSEANGFIGMFGGVFTKALPTLQITVAVLLAAAGMISVGGVIAAGFLIGKAISPMKTLIDKWEDVVKAKLAYQRLDDLLTARRAFEAKMSLPSPVGKLDADNLSISTNNGRILLEQVSFSLPAGQIMAVVGPNGAGKTTLLKAILGLYRPHEGTLRLDGAQLCDWNHDELGPHIGYVAQTSDLFEASVAENIARLGEVDSDKVVAAAKAAGVHEMILAFPQGYDTVLLNGEFGLSVGQAQRLSIARAMYNNPKLLVLDEPNASLDEASELALIASIKQIQAKGVTVVLSSHRPKVIGAAQWLLVIKQGKQVAFGLVADVLGRASNAASLKVVEGNA